MGYVPATPWPGGPQLAASRVDLGTGEARTPNWEEQDSPMDSTFYLETKQQGNGMP